jgi:hypothetical protein
MQPVYNSLTYCVIREFSKPKRWNAKGILFFHIYTFLDSDFSTLIENRNNFQFWQDFCVKSWLFPFTNFMSFRRLRLFFFFIGTNIIIPYSFFVCKTVGWVDIGHHFDSFTIATTTWLTTMVYLCHKWQRICSTDMGPFNGKKHQSWNFLEQLW